MTKHDNTMTTQTEVLEAGAEWRVGQWLIWDAAGYFSDPRYEASEIVKLTPKTVTIRGTWGRDTRRNIDGKELWAGPEIEAKALAERLNSSVGLMKGEVRRSRERHQERASKLVQASRRGGEA